MKCEKCGGYIERVAYNCDIGDRDLWDCICENCGHIVLDFPAECNCGEKLEFIGYSDKVILEEGFKTGVFRCVECKNEELRVMFD